MDMYAGYMIAAGLAVVVVIVIVLYFNKSCPPGPCPVCVSAGSTDCSSKDQQIKLWQTVARLLYYKDTARTTTCTNNVCTYTVSPDAPQFTQAQNDFRNLGPVDQNVAAVRQVLPNFK
jgi:hypothetical protein